MVVRDNTDRAADDFQASPRRPLACRSASRLEKLVKVCASTDAEACHSARSVPSRAGLKGSGIRRGKSIRPDTSQEVAIHCRAMPESGAPQNRPSSRRHQAKFSIENWPPCRAFRSEKTRAPVRATSRASYLASLVGIGRAGTTPARSVSFSWRVRPDGTWRRPRACSLWSRPPCGICAPSPHPGATSWMPAWFSPCSPS